MRKRTHRSLLIALALLAAISIALVLRAKAPPEAARLLPECDAIAYLNVKAVRALGHVDLSSIARSADLQRFEDATGINPETDIDAAAIGLHRVPVAPVKGAKGKQPTAEIFASEVFIGKFDGEKLAKYLTSVATSRESYAGHDVFTVSIDGETLRVAQLGYDTIATSNMPTAEQIHSMLDRHRASALGTPGSSLLAARYSEVPQLPLPSEAWAIGHIGLPFAANGHISVLGLQLPLSENTDFVASLRYSGSIKLRVEEIAPSDADAQHTVETMNTLLGIFHGIQDAQPAETPGAQAMRAVFSSIALEQHKDRAILSASATLDQVRAIAAASSAPPVAVAPVATPAAPAASKH